MRGSQEFINIIKELGCELLVTHQKGSIHGLFRTTEGRLIYPLHLWTGNGGFLTFLQISYRKTEVG